MSNVRAEVKSEGKNKVLVITMPIMAGTLSKSEKNKVVATTRGGLSTTAEVEGKQVTINVNAYIPAQ